MTVLLVLSLIIVSILSYLLFAPFFLEINTKEDLCRLRFHKLASISLRVDESMVADIKMGWWSKQIDLLAPKASSIQKNKLQTSKKTIKSKKEFSLRKIKAVLKSFHVNECNIILNTGNMQMNGILFPWFYCLSIYANKNIRISFIEENIIILKIKNSLASIAWAYFKS